MWKEIRLFSYGIFVFIKFLVEIFANKNFNIFGKSAKSTIIHRIKK